MRATSPALLLPLAAAGCISVIHPPDSPDDPVTVYLLVRAKHRGIVLPLPAEGGHVEYGYGEWGWYAENQDAWYNVFDTLFWPTRGALGRRPTAAGTREELERSLDALLEPVVVSRARAAELLAHLESEFERAGREEPEGVVFNPQQGMRFVRHGRRFWLFWNCADQTAEWFRALGCRVSQVLIRLGIKVERP